MPRDPERPHLPMRARAVDRAVRVGWIERAGYHREGQWQFRMTDKGLELRELVRRRRALGLEESHLCRDRSWGHGVDRGGSIPKTIGVEGRNFVD